MLAHYRDCYRRSNLCMFEGDRFTLCIPIGLLRGKTLPVINLPKSVQARVRVCGIPYMTLPFRIPLQDTQGKKGTAHDAIIVIAE